MNEGLLTAIITRVQNRLKSLYLRPTLTGIVFCLFVTTQVFAAEKTLDAIDFSSTPGGKVEFRLQLSGAAEEPKIFHTENPARIALDLDEVENKIDEKTIPVNVGVVSRIQVMQAAQRTRVVFNLVKMAPFETRVEGDQLIVSVNNSVVTDEKSSAPSTQNNKRSIESVLPRQAVKDIDFRRGTGGEGRILIDLSNPNTVVDMKERGGKIVLNFLNTSLPTTLSQNLDVTDFATPVKSIETVTDGSNVRMTITPAIADYDYLSYQTDGSMTVEFRPLTPAEKEALKESRFKYTGEKLSLNFQDIEVRSVLQILADFTNLNIVASDAVNGSITLRLNDVPWDQAMDIILKSKGLAKRETGNVMLVAPSEDINKIEKEELEALAVREELEPLRTELIQVNYAKAADIQAVLMGVKDESSEVSYNVPGPDYTGYITQPEASAAPDINRGSIMSARGVVNIDARTNILIVKDTARNLEAIRQLIDELDKPVRQVLIESRVVIANDDFTKEIGVRFGGNIDLNSDDDTQDTIISGGSTDNYIVDLPAAVGNGVGGAINFSMLKVGEYLLDLELSALQTEGRGEIISTPRVVTSDQTQASIEQGVEIPFQTVSQDGTQTEFKKAVLKLEVTPQITPDDSVIMELLIQKDAAGAQTTDGLAIDKREIQTTVQVNNGETIVLGGVFEGERQLITNKVPFFGDLPLVGFLFRNDNNQNDKSELLIFITPKILKGTLTP